MSISEQLGARTSNIDTGLPYGEILASEQQLDMLIGVMAVAVVDHYAEERPLFVCLLKGGMQFSYRLLTEIARVDPDFHPELEYAKVKTYGDGRQAKGSRVIFKPDSELVKGRRIAMLDDLLDEGSTAEAMEGVFLADGATGVDLLVLAEKVKKRRVWEHATMSALEIPDLWVTGSGCDDAGVAREGNRFYPGLAVALDYKTPLL